MVEIYVSWIKGLPQDEKALKILKDSRIIAGIEMSNIDSQVEMIQDAGLKFSAHTPGMALTLNLASDDILANIKQERLLSVIKNSNASVVGFHLGYSARNVLKMMAFPNVPDPKTIISNEGLLKKIITDNLIEIGKIINPTGIAEQEKKIAIETLDYSRNRPVSWEKQLDEIKLRKNEVQKVIDEYGINAGILHVTEPWFVNGILQTINVYDKIFHIGFLFDIAHNFISADAKIFNGETYKSIGDYFEIMLAVVKGKTYQLHLTVPAGDDETGYNDHHHPFNHGNPLSDKIMDLSKMVYEKTKETVETITLEIKTDLTPVEHAKKMVEQTNYIIKELNL